ncbi:1-acyl-sn-glycerol-3-phosphate acyltransferase [Enterobacterales bacterium CwR94]|nr:1-acyl-sn-glycerol-3-phosphate acyltransferase [Enterobacterales bacterium CwR94]
MTSRYARVEQAWRLVMTGLCFVLFGLGGLLLSMLWFNILFILLRDPARRRRIARQSISASFRFFLRTTKVLGVLDYHVEGADILKREQGCLVVANHPTLIDYVILASVMPETDCLVKSALLKNPFVSGVIRAADYLINSQSETLLSDCSQRLARGDTVLIFPEGTRTRPGEPMTLQRGAANIAVRCQCDLRVVTIHCTEHLLDKQSRWYDIPPRKPHFHLQVRERIHTRTFIDNAADAAPSLAARQLNRHLLQQLSRSPQSLAGMEDANALS